MCGPESAQLGRHSTDEESVGKVEEEEVRREVAEEQLDFVPVLTDPSHDMVVVSLEEAALESISESSYWCPWLVKVIVG